MEGRHARDLPKDFSKGGISMSTIAPNNLDQPTGHTVAWNSLLAQSYRLYSKKFWTFFRIALLPALLAYLWRYGYHLAIHEFTVRGWISYRSGGFVLLIASGWVDGAFYWIVSSFFFAAISTNVLATADEERPTISDVFTRARAHIGAITVVALLSWTIFWLGRAAAEFALLTILERFRIRPDFYSRLLIFSIPFLLLAGLLSRLGLVVPRLMDMPAASLKEALRTSIQKTEGWELFFMMFLAKSAILALISYWLGNYGFDWLWRHGTLNATTYPWASQTLYICFAAALESPLFIAFAILYQNSSKPQDNVLSEAAVL
jgi:hypothetical protein